MDEMMWNVRETAAMRARYDRVASLYDAMEALIEPRYSNWRGRAWSLVMGWGSTSTGGQWRTCAEPGLPSSG